MDVSHLEALVPSLLLSPTFIPVDCWYSSYATLANERLAKRAEDGGQTLRFLRDVAGNNALAAERTEREAAIAARLAGEARRVVAARRRAAGDASSAAFSPLTSQEARAVLSSLLPSTAPEPDPEAAEGDAVFLATLRAVAAGAGAAGGGPDMPAVADVLRRHLSASCRALPGALWRPPSVAEVLRGMAAAEAA